MVKMVAVNGNDRSWTRGRYILGFGQYLRLMVWANSCDDALDEAVDWIADNKPGLLHDNEVAEAYAWAIEQGKSEEEASEEAEVDMTIAGNAGHYLLSSEWTIVAENPTRAEVLALLTN